MSVSALKLADKPGGDGLLTLSRDEFSEIAMLVQRECGIHLTSSKIGLIVSRLQRRIVVLGLDSFTDYISLLKSKSGAQEIEEMISKITTNVTSFNRESHHFDHFRQNVLPGLINSARDGNPVRLWSAGCSDGREPYTLACAIFDAFPEVRKYDFRILASDIDKYSLAKAKSGEYSTDMAASLPSGYAENWFKKVGDNLKIKEEVGGIIQFNWLNLMSPWPMKKKFDVIFCRNVLIYFSAEDQVRVLDKFSQNLKPNCHLYLGHSERVDEAKTTVLRQVGVTTYVHEPKGNQI